MDDNSQSHTESQKISQLKELLASSATGNCFVCGQNLNDELSPSSSRENCFLCNQNLDGLHSLSANCCAAGNVGEESLSDEESEDPEDDLEARTIPLPSQKTPGTVHLPSQKSQKAPRTVPLPSQKKPRSVQKFLNQTLWCVLWLAAGTAISYGAMIYIMLCYTDCCATSDLHEFDTESDSYGYSDESPKFPSEECDGSGDKDDTWDDHLVCTRESVYNGSSDCEAGPLNTREPVTRAEFDPDEKEFTELVN